MQKTGTTSPFVFCSHLCGILVFIDFLNFWGLGAQQMISITFWPRISCKNWISWGYSNNELWQKPELRTEQSRCSECSESVLSEQSKCLPSGGGLLHGLCTVCTGVVLTSYLPHWTPNLFSFRGQQYRERLEISWQNWQYGLEYFLLKMGRRLDLLMWFKQPLRTKPSKDYIEGC